MTKTNCEQVHIMVARDTLTFFQKCKSTLATSVMTDSDFLQILLGHFEKCTKESRFQISNGNKEHVCPECDFVAASIADMSSHFDSRHSVEASFSCTCGLSFDHMPAFLRHYIECPIAATDLQDPGRAKRADSPTRLKKNVTEIINNNKEMEIDIPNLLGSYKSSPVVPVNGPSNDKPFGCPHCQKGFKSKSLLEQHMHLHYPPRYKCRWCSKVYRWPPVYYHHMRICKKIQSLKQTCHADSEKSSTTISDICKEEIRDNRSESTLTSNKILTSAGDSLSSICIDSVPEVTSLNNLSGGSNSFESTEAIDAAKIIDCSQNSVTPEDTLSSSINSSGQVKLFTCNICNKEFTSKLSLKQHVDGKHRLEGKYVCQLCGKRYRWGASFYYHRRTCISTSIINFSTTPDVPSLPHHVSQPSA